LGSRWTSAPGTPPASSPRSSARLLEPGGRVWVSSCSYYVKEADLLEAARRAGADARTRFRVVRITHQPEDHPWVAQVPETLYLKTLVLEPYPLLP